MDEGRRTVVRDLERARFDRALAEYVAELRTPCHDPAVVVHAAMLNAAVASPPAAADTKGR